MPSRAANAADCVPEPCFIAGTQMRPFCLGHHLLFRRLGLPFTGNPAADCGQDDILIGVLICAQSYEETMEQLESETWEGTLRTWLKRVMKRRTNVDDVDVRFRLYLAKGYTEPPVCTGSAGAIALSAPWECLIKVGLVRAGFSEADALNGYLPMRKYDYYTAMELTASETCEDPAKWKPIFYTRKEAELIERAKEAAKQNG